MARPRRRQISAIQSRCSGFIRHERRQIRAPRVAERIAKAFGLDIRKEGHTAAVSLDQHRQLSGLKRTMNPDSFSAVEPAAIQLTIGVADQHNANFGRRRHHVLQSLQAFVRAHGSYHRHVAAQATEPGRGIRTRLSHVNTMLDTNA